MIDSVFAIRGLNLADIPAIVGYHNVDQERFGRLMGRGPDAELPDAARMTDFLETLIKTSRDRQIHSTDILVEDGVAIGHIVLRNIVAGEQAELHFHVWRGRMQGRNLAQMLAIGRHVAALALKHLFTAYNLQLIIGEPSLRNPLPNRVLRSMGLKPVKSYRTKPGPLAGTMFVNRYEIPRTYFPELIG